MPEHKRIQSKLPCQPLSKLQTYRYNNTLLTLPHSRILSIVAIVLSVLLSLSLLSIYGLDPLGKSLGGALQSVKDMMTHFMNDLLGNSNSDPMVIEHGTDEFSPKVWQGPRQLEVNSKTTNEKPLDEDKGGNWWPWS